MENTIPSLRAKRNLSQAALAAELNVSRQTVVSLEKGRYDPSLPLAFRIARVFDCTIEDIFVPDGAPQCPDGSSGPSVPAHQP